VVRIRIAEEFSARAFSYSAFLWTSSHT
jgi:hypothetical protein